MKILNKLNFIHLLLLFILLHLVLLNINAAEWGDSYRILRAAEYVREFSYPQDEKRPPLFSVALAIRPQNIDPVLWGRVFMLGISTLFFVVYYKFAKLILDSKAKVNLALLLLIFNPTFLYWSIRIMADVPFALITLASVYFYTKYKSQLSFKHIFLLSALCATAIMTRFEGYLLCGAIFIGLLYIEPISSIKEFFPKQILVNIKKNYKFLLSFLIFTLFLLIPFLIFKNPLQSTYFEEPSTRSYGLQTTLIYIISILFLTGLIPAFYFYLNNLKNIKTFFYSNLFLFSFFTVELILILFWPAAIPRLFVPIIFIFTILLSDSIVEVFSKESKPNIYIFLIINSILLGLYVVGIYIFNIQFLVMLLKISAIIFLLSLALVYLIYKQKLSYFVFLSITIMSIWAVSVIWMHKDIFKVIQKANVYAVTNLSGIVAYNDISSVSNWYLNTKNNSEISGKRIELQKVKDELATYMPKNNIKYLLITNEHDLNLQFDASKRPFLTEVYRYQQDINGANFWSVIYKFNTN